MCFSVHHSFADAAGVGSLMSTYAAHCTGRAPDIPAVILDADRTHLIQGSDFDDALQYHGRLWKPFTSGCPELAPRISAALQPERIAMMCSIQAAT